MKLEKIGIMQPYFFPYIGYWQLIHAVDVFVVYDDGKMIKSDWVKYKGQWFYMGADGAMVVGWQTIGGKMYHFANSGDMAQDEWVDGYFCDMSGTANDRQGKWHEDDAGNWYSDNTGWYPRSRSVRIDGEDYEFNKNGYQKV